MKTKLEELLERPFDAYMRGCWQHAFDKAGTDPIAMYIYEMAVKEPAAIEAQWAKRYWFHKNGAYENEIRFCEFIGDGKHFHDEVGYKKKCEHIGIMDNCLKHKQELGEFRGWRVCCEACTEPVQIKEILSEL